MFHARAAALVAVVSVAKTMEQWPADGAGVASENFAVRAEGGGGGDVSRPCSRSCPRRHGARQPPPAEANEYAVKIITSADTNVLKRNWERGQVPSY